MLPPNFHPNLVKYNQGNKRITTNVYNAKGNKPEVGHDSDTSDDLRKPRKYDSSE